MRDERTRSKGGEREVGVFEESQLAEHEDECGAQPCFAGAVARGAFHLDGAEEVDQSDYGQQHAPNAGIFVVEIIGKRSDVQQTNGRCLVPGEEGVAHHEG